VRPVSNTILYSEIQLYLHKNNLHINLGSGWCIMESSELKKILERVKLTAYHQRYGRYPRLRWEEPNVVP
jgi:hypothetical protein